MSSTNSVGNFKLEENETVALGATPPAPVAEEIDTSFKSPVKAMLEKIKSAKALVNPKPTVKKHDFIVLPYDAFGPNQFDITFCFNYYQPTEQLFYIKQSFILHDPEIKFHTRSDTLPTPGIGECKNVILKDLCSINKTSELLKNGPGEIDFSRVAIECDPKKNVGFTREYNIFTACGNYTEELHLEMNRTWKSSGVKTVRQFIQWYCNIVSNSCLSTVPPQYTPIDLINKVQEQDTAFEICEPKTTLFSDITTQFPKIAPVLLRRIKDLYNLPNYIIHHPIVKGKYRSTGEIGLWINTENKTGDINFSARMVPDRPGNYHIEQRNTFLLKSKVTGLPMYTYDQDMHVFFNDQWKSLELKKPTTLGEYKDWTDLTLSMYLVQTNSEFST